MEQLLNALLAIVIGVGVMLLYFFGSNWLLDTLVADRIGRPGETFVSREKQRERIRPWLFVAPALALLTLYLIYPALQTLILSFFDDDAEAFIAFGNYTRALNDSRFLEAIGNNLLWLLVVPTCTVVFGLLTAVLADGVRWGNIAKSLIFMPMAISFVGASVIWKFVYTINPDIGLLNALHTGSGAQPVDVMQIPFWNNFTLMIVLVWIQTGFAMVIFSAALRGVPEETLEAARIDGASEIQTFFRIMLPQIMGTVFVVWTTDVIRVLKVFDIVLAMTNGNWNTQVLANYMYDQMFRAFDTGYASFLALVIMAAVVPIMIVNIRRMNREEAFR